MRPTLRNVICMALLFAGSAPRAGAIELSHFFPGLPNFDDLFLPPTEAGRFIYAQYNTLYTTTTLKDFSGREVESLTVRGPLGRPIEVDVDIDVDNVYLAPTFMWAPRFSILGARYGAFVALPVGNTSLAADLQTAIGLGRSVNDTDWGVGDVYVQPLWLMWTLDRADLTAAYGFNAPSGKYSDGATDNVGLGFWEHLIQSAVRYHFDDAKNFSASLAGTFEIGHEKEDADITPGSHFTLNWGIRNNFSGQWLQLAIVGYQSWQTTDDTGSAAPPRDERHRDEVHAAGAQIGIPKLGLALKYMHEYRAKDRFEGEVLSLMFALPLEVIGGMLWGA